MMTQVMDDPALRLLLMVNGYQVSQALHAAATLNLAHFVSDVPRDASAIATDAGTAPAPTYRLLRALASIGVFHETDDNHVAANDLSNLLRADDPASMRGWAVFVGRPMNWELWGDLINCVRTGEDAARHLHGASIWDVREGLEEENAIFNAAMGSLSGGVIPGILASGFDFQRFVRIVDVGGGNGTLLAAILGVNLSPRGTVFDLPHVVSGVAPLMAAAGLQDRCDAVSGNFFTDSVPSGADAYILKNIILDCTDEDAIRILRNVRDAMPTHGRLLIIEGMASAPDGNRASTFLDLQMLVATGGQVRTTAQWGALFASSGLSLLGVTPAGPTAFILETRAV